MIPRHPDLSVELRNEADDLRRYARELDASGDAEGAAAVRDQSMHVDEWVDAVVELEADSAELRELLEAPHNTPGKLRARLEELEALEDNVSELLAGAYPPVTDPRGRVLDKPATRASVPMVLEALETLARILGEAGTAGLERMTERAKALAERTTDLETERVEITWETLRRCPKGSDGRIAYLKTQILDEVVDRLPLPPSVTDTISRMLEEESEYLPRNATIARLVDVVASKAETLRSMGAERVTEAHRSALVELLEAFDDAGDTDTAAERLDKAIAAARALVGVAAPAALAVDGQSAARARTREALDALAATRREVAGLTHDHPLQLEYEGAVEAIWVRAKPKAKIPRTAEGRFDVQAAGDKLPADARAEADTVRAAFAERVKGLRARLDAELERAKADLAEAAARVVPRPTRGARTLIAPVSVSTYSTQTAPESYARGRAEIHAAEVRRYCPEATVTIDIVRSTDGARIMSFDVYADLDEVDRAALDTVGVDLVERVRAAYKHGCNPRVFWPMLPPDFETRHGLDRFGGRTVTP